MHDALSNTISRRSALRRLSLVLGGVATAPLASGLLGGCRTPAAGEAYAYQTLAEPQQRTLAALVDQILPATDTPGAADVGVPQFVDLMLTDWYAPDERDGFLAGLADVDGRAEGGSFAALDGEAQARLVAQMDAETYPPAPPEEPVDGDVAGAAQEGTYNAEEEREREVAGMQGELGEAMNDEAGDQRELQTGEGQAHAGASDDAPPFFRQLKELTLAGYYTSEAGATEELQWLAVPGRYDADVPLSDVGRAWA
ncbi:gluconate 2-dehydrogenase subunit 3 family protein [Rubrivirga sp. S365]|uniref:gluconate 2-dehydrogenase subunit 3 family protein n=1 Tax=Rubrivirga sp. S365 TaxID=3076080 RepID=UPI0028C5F0FC|nr:gluconate 2-dehydrogenase subunit 3 family protein [Rubrivirga sp. S365]MDT7855769.1 gluconate 2-dehydrogenase subunit 3 family protein [Rubrivirga sp. S365]